MPTNSPPEYVPPHFEFVSVHPTDHDNDMFAVPRWVLGVLAEELTGHTDCGGENEVRGCARCEAIRVALEASDAN
jgi:hypothetical protein